MSTRTRGRPAKLDFDQIIEAALGLGLQNLTMTRLANRLGVGMATLYHHVSGIDAVTEAVADQLINDTDVMLSNSADPDLKSFLYEAGTRLREMFSAAPGFAAIANRSPRLRGRILAVHEKATAKLVELGLGPGQALMVIRVLADYIESSTARDDLWAAGENTKASLKQNHKDAHSRNFPFLQQAYAELGYDYLEDQFELGLRALSIGLASESSAAS